MRSSAVPANPSEPERLLRLCRRLLRQNEDLHEQNQDLHAQIDRLLGSLRWLGGEYREMTARLARAEADHAVIEAASDAMLGAAFDEPLSGAPRG
jgi:hypothetical protein